MKNKKYIIAMMLLLPVTLISFFMCFKEHIKKDTCDNEVYEINDTLKFRYFWLKEKIKTLQATVDDYRQRIDSLKKIPAQIEKASLEKLNAVQTLSSTQITKHLNDVMIVECGTDISVRTTIIEEDTFALLGHQEMKCVSEAFIERDKWKDVAGVYGELNVQYESTIDVLNEQVALQAEALDNIEQQNVTLLEHYMKELRKNERNERRAKVWRGLAVVSVIINVILFSK